PMVKSPREPLRVVKPTRSYRPVVQVVLNGFTVTCPLAGVVESVVVKMPAAPVPAMRGFSVPAPLKVSEPIVSAPVPPSPLVIVLLRLFDTTTVLIVAVPSTVQPLTFTVGVTATELLLTKVAPLPLTLMVLLLLIAPDPLNLKVPLVTLVGP